MLRPTEQRNGSNVKRQLNENERAKQRNEKAKSDFYNRNPHLKRK